jgi:hypothetical protein
MNSEICTNVNNLSAWYNVLCNEITTLKNSVDDNTITVPELENKNLKIKDLTVDNIILNEDLTAVCGDIVTKNLNVTGTLNSDTLVTDNFNADDITCDKCTATQFIGCTAHIKNVYSTLVESQTMVTTSDKKLKNSITPILSERLKELYPVRFKYNNNDERFVYGLIAQDVEKIYPDMVFTLEDGNKAIDYNQLISLLIFKTNDIEERLSSIEKTQASIKTFTGLLILALFIIIILLFLPRKYLNPRYLLRVFTGR